MPEGERVHRGVRIKLTGLVTIEHDGCSPRHLSSAQAQVAFARMALERASGTSREQLADAIWPEGLPDTWASALRSVVSRVRAFVARAQPPDAITLVAQGGRYLLRLPPNATVDLECAQQAVSEASEAFTAGAFADAQRLAAIALSCVRGPFLPYHEGEWVSGVRDRLDELLVCALETASLAASARSDEHNALRFAEEAVKRAPLRESAHRCRMTAHVAAGNRAEALRSYHQLRRILAEELGIDPAPETQAAYVDLLGSPGTSSGGSPGPARPGPSCTAPFVGRRVELAALGDAWSQAGQGASHLVLITGEPGVGKTRLVTETARRISLAGGLVMYGRCDHKSIVPCQPFVEALDGFIAATPDDALPELSHTVRETLAALVAEPRHRLEEVTSSRRARCLLAVTDLLVRVAQDRPVFLVLDDLDLADDDTLMLLRQVFRRRSETSLLIVATAGAPVPRRDRFVAAMHDIDREGWLGRVALRGLSEPDVRALVRQVLPESCGHDAPSPHQLIADTAGNPYLLLELLRWQLDQDSSASHQCGGIPSGINEYATAALAALEPASRQLLRVAATIGRSFELELTAEAAGLDLDQSMDALDILVTKGILAEVITAAPGQQHLLEYRFTHDVLRRAIYGQCSGARRRWLHTRLANVVELRHADDADEMTPMTRATTAGRWLTISR